MEQGVFQIINEEGAICQVDTTDENSRYSGSVWQKICESKLWRHSLSAVFDGIQYKSNNGKQDFNSPAGFRVKIMGEVDAFLPGNHFIKWRSFDEDFEGNEFLVKVKEFDPHSGQVIVTETSSGMPLIAEAYRENKLLKGEIMRYQFKTNGIEEFSSYPTGLMVKIEDVESFLPIYNFAKWRDTEDNCSGQKIVVMVDKFDDSPTSVILNEVPTTDISNIDVDLLNETLELIGEAYENGKSVAGTIVGEKYNRNMNRAGYCVSINGLEAFLPCNLAPENLHTDLSHVFGVHIIARVETIDAERKGIILSAANFFGDRSQTKSTEISDQPLIIFTDASVVPNKEISSFAIVAQNIIQNFEVPQNIIDKYNLEIEPESSSEVSVFSGIVLNFGVDAAELIALFAAVEIMMYLITATEQKIVIYTDSLFTKKLLESDQLEDEQLMYKDVIESLRTIVAEKEIDITLKKVKAHAGLYFNELADRVAKRRRREF